MTIWWLVFILAVLASAGIGFIWLLVRLGKQNAGPAKQADDSYQDQAEKEAERIFSNDFREELRNRGRLHFEKIISENAMFLQQDLRLTTSQINEYMQDVITKKLKEEFGNYEQSIADAKQLAIDAIEKTNTAIEEQRQLLGQQLQQQAAEQKQRLIQNFANNMAEIVNHYLLAAIGDQIDLTNQLEFILEQLEANKAAIIEDVRSGA